MRTSTLSPVRRPRLALAGFTQWLGGALLVSIAGCADGASAPPTGTPTGAAIASGTGSGGATSSMLDEQGNPIAPSGTGIRVNEDGVLVDAQGNPLVDANGNPLMLNEDGVVVDANGNPVTDDRGNPLVVGTDPPEGGGTTPTIPGELSNCTTPGPRQVRRLTSDQYARTLQNIFSDPNVPVETVLSDGAVLGFHVDATAAVVRDLEGELLMNHAESVADWAVDNGKVAQFTSCTEQRADCQTSFIASFGAKAHREPLSDTTIEAYRGLFDEEPTFDDGLRSVISAMLQSPFLLYRRELGAEQDGEFALSPYEVASQLSYWITDAPPDEALYEAAASGRLSTSEDYAREASRLLETPYARETLAAFLEGWLHLDKLASKAKDESVLPLPTELRTSMLEESVELFLNTFYDGGSLEDLFTATHTYVDQRLAAHYGISGVGQGSERVGLDGTNRPAGVLGHAAFLTTHALSDNSSPVQRAKVVIERLVCGTLPAVPADLNVALDTETEFSTNRERYEVHRQRDDCRSCHENLDPIGYAFEHFDGFGRYRDQENGVDIDATGSLAVMGSGPVPLDGVDSLSVALANSPELQSCLVRFWSYYTFGAEGWQGAECNRDGVIRDAREEGFTLRSVLMGIARSPHFSRRVADQ